MPSRRHDIISRESPYEFANDWFGVGARRVTKRDSVSDIDVVNSNVSAHVIEQINAKITGFGGVFISF